MKSKAGRQASTMARHGVFLHGITRHGNAMHGTGRQCIAVQCKAQHFDTSANLATQGFGKAPHLLALAMLVKGILRLLELLLAFI